MNGLDSEYGEWLNVYAYDTDNPNDGAVAAQYGVRGLPTIVILDANGGVAARMSGLNNADSLRSAINRTIN